MQIYLIVTLSTLSLFMTGCFKKRPAIAPCATPATVIHPGRSGVFDEDDEILALDLPTLSNALFDDQAQQDLGITIFAEQTETADETTRAFFRPLYFEYDRHALKPGQSANLENNIAAAKKLLAQGYTIILEGHSCTSGGSESYNMQLSERRAQSIRTEFVRAGIPEASIKCVGRGTSDCIMREGSRAQQGPNRRVEVVGIKS